jgi:hypothetical protein
MFSSSFCKRLFARKPASVRPRGYRPRLESLEDRTVPSTLIVTTSADSGTGSLRDAIAAAASGNTIRFASSLDHQTITLKSQLTLSKNLDIEGPGAGLLTISGAGTNRVFAVAAGAAVTLDELTIANGFDAILGQGGGIDNAGTLAVSHDVLSNNEALGTTANNGGLGGGIFNEAGGVLKVTDSTFTGNQVVGGPTGLGFGGGLMNLGTASVSNCTFTGDQATGGGAGFGSGGGISDQTFPTGGVGILSVTNSVFTNNVVSDGSGPFGEGGGIDVASGASLTVTNSTFLGNEAVATTPFSSSFGGGINNFAGTVSADSCTFKNNLSTGTFASGGGLDGQVFTTNTVTNCTFTGNQAVSNHPGGFGAGGGIDNEFSATLILSNSKLMNNVAQGAVANPSFFFPVFTSYGFGGGIVNGSASSATLTSCTINDNQAVGGAGVAGADPGGAIGGGIEHEISSTLTLVNCSLNGNEAIGGAGASGEDGGQALGGGIGAVLSSAVSMSGSTLNNNAAIGGAGGAGANGGAAWGGAILVGAPAIDVSPGAPDSSALIASNSQFAGNLAQGGAGGVGGNGGDGLGGGIFLNGTSSLCLTYSNVTGNRAEGGTGGSGGSAGAGQGGGLYITPGAVAGGNHDHIGGNHASTSDDDIFGVFSPSC